MFTGIVTHQGHVVVARETEGRGRRFVLRAEPDLEGVKLGDSIAVDGVCLTVAAFEDDRPAFDVVPETLRKTTLGEREPGQVVNLERSLRLGDEMGGHNVQGHVEGVAEVVGVETQGEDVRMSLCLPAELFAGMIPKGSVAIDGVSLTIGEVWQEDGDGEGGRISVYLVPHTLAVTSLGRREAGDRVNIEPDVLARLVEHHVRRILGQDVTEGESR